MLPHTRAVIAAAAYAFISGRKVAGLYDHAAGQHRRIAAEGRGEHLQGLDGDRDAKFGGTLPELFDAGDGTYASMRIGGSEAHGFDRKSAAAFTLVSSGELVQLYDHGERNWYAFTIRTA